MKLPLMRVSLAVECVVPHDTAALTQGQIIEAIAQAVVEGGMSAELQIQFADNKASLYDVHQAIKQMWLARLAADSMRFEMAKSMADALPLNDSGQLEEDFLVWPAGSSIADVRGWFKTQAGGHS
jgi:hypothetical protein